MTADSLWDRLWPPPPWQKDEPFLFQTCGIIGDLKPANQNLQPPRENIHGLETLRSVSGR